MYISTNTAILLPAAVLICWTLVMLVWLAITRLPTMSKSKIHPQKYPRTQDLGAALPAAVQWKADNYNHLMEQPTIFYATVFLLVLIGEGGGMNVILAWTYVGLRIAHSLVQATINIVMVRFTLFVLSSIILTIMAVNSLLALL
ncbi:MAG: MAPEG family protein [Halioglobus sp.]|nr:MAPEG family protein [Halioglobus sp.]